MLRGGGGENYTEAAGVVKCEANIGGECMVVVMVMVVRVEAEVGMCCVCLGGRVVVIRGSMRTKSVGVSECVCVCVCMCVCMCVCVCVCVLNIKN